jgi:hypothetical protein
MHVVITGVGAATPVGDTAAETWAALLAGESGVRVLDGERYEGLPVRLAAPLRTEPEDRLDRVEARNLDRSQRVALLAAREAWADAGAPGVDPIRLAVVVGTGIGGAHTLLEPRCWITIADGGRVTIGDPQSTGTGDTPNYPSQVLVTADGSYAYVANRGHNSLTRYAIEAKGSRLRLLDTVPVHGDWPRHTAFSPDGRLLFVSNQRSSSVTVFHVDRGSGELRLAGEPFASPVAVCALPL